MTHTYPKFIRILPCPSPQLGACHTVSTGGCNQLHNNNANFYPSVLQIIYMNITEAIIELCSLHNGVF